MSELPASTAADCVFGRVGVQPPPADESQPLVPLLIYSNVKVAQNHIQMSTFDG